MATNLDPDIVAAARRDGGEPFVREDSRDRQVVLNRAEVVERLSRLRRQQLGDHPGHRLESQRTRGNLGLSGWRNDIRALARMEDERVTVRTNNRGQERGYERHNRFSAETARYFIVK